MGTVHLARQVALGREVALKQIQSKHDQKQSVKDEFLTEAVLTGKLEHPNIVPIYEVAKSASGDLFYSMKNIKGRDWNDSIDTLSLEENLDILINVSDAIAFAHAEGVVHRDLKPQNIMTGGFGEVLVLDWGLAVLTGPEGEVTASAAGTPSYMAPEMVNPPFIVGPRSDIYLLGAILFKILTGTAPHVGKSAFSCLEQASKNQIATPDEERVGTLDPSGELLGVALRAMETQPQDRFQTVPEFQQAVRDFLSHRESLELSSRSQASLQSAESSRDYTEYSRAVFGFEEALKLWSGNVPAAEGVIAARLAWALCAESQSDFDLSLSLLDDTSEYQEIRARVNAGRDEREARQHKIRLLRRVSMATSLAVAVVTSVAAVWIGIERSQAETEKNNAILAQKQEAAQRKIAQRNEAEAIKQKGKAETQRLRAEANLAKATAAEAVAKKEATTNKAVSSFLVGMFQGSDPLGLNGFRFGTTDTNRAELTAKQLLYQGSTKIVDELKNEHAARATLMNTIGNSLRSLAEWKNAKPLIEGALDLRRQIYQGDHLEVAESLHNLGWLRQDEGKYIEAIEIYREALAMRERLTAKNSEVATQTMSQLGWVLAMELQYEEAESLLQQVIDNRQRLLGEDHRLVGLAIFAYAAMQIQRGDVNLATLLRVNKAATILSRHEGTENIGAVIHACQYAMFHHRISKNYKAAEPKYQQAIELAGKLLGKRHPYVLMIQHEYGNLLFNLKKYDECEKLLTFVWNGCTAVAPLDHPKTVIASSSLARVLDHNKKYKEAKELYETILPVRIKSDEGPHKSAQTRLRLMIAYDNLGRSCQTLKLWKEARDHFLKCLEIRKPSADEIKEKQILASRYTRLGLIHKQLSELDKSREYYEKALQQYAALVASKPESMTYKLGESRAIFAIGKLEREFTNFEKAIVNFQQAVAVSNAFEGQKEFDDNKIRVANLNVYRRQLAMTQLEARALKDLEFVLQEDPLQAKTHLILRAKVFAKRGKMDAAVLEIERIKKRASTKKEPGYFVDVARCYCICSKHVIPWGKTNDKLTEEQNTDKEKDAKHAVRALQQAVDAGWSSTTALENMQDLDVIRDRDDFRQIITDLKKKTPAKPIAPPEVRAID